MQSNIQYAGFYKAQWFKFDHCYFFSSCLRTFYLRYKHKRLKK